MIHSVAVAGLCLSGVAFVLFVISVLVQLFRRRPPAGAGGGAGEAAEQQALGPEEVAKLIEAFAKLAEVFNHSGPTVLTLMASIIFFVLALLAASVEALRSEPTSAPKAPGRASISPAIQVCVLYPFDVGQHRLGQDGIKRLKQTPNGCARSIVEQAGKGTVTVLLLIGHADRQPLSGERLRYYGTNEALAYQRALEVKRLMIANYDAATTQTPKPDAFSERIVVLSAGSSYVDRRADAEQLAHDRSVEIVAYQADSAKLQATQ